MHEERNTRELNTCWSDNGISAPVKSVKKDKAEDIRMTKHYIKKTTQEKTVDS